MALELINNRTFADVENAKRIISKVNKGEELTESESIEYYSGLRGAYNASDINRVMNAMTYLAEQLNTQGYVFNFPVWANVDDTFIFKESNWQEYLNLIKDFRENFPLPEDVPQAPTTLFTINAYQKANDIESILMKIENYVAQTNKAYYYLGEVELGEIY